MDNQISEELMAPYDDIAAELVVSKDLNSDVDLPYSNWDLVEIVCKTLDVEDFDLFETHDFEHVHVHGNAERCLAYAFIAFLRWRVFSRALQLNVGIHSFSEKAQAHSEYWYIKLVDRWSQLNPDAKPMPKWVN